MPFEKRSLEVIRSQIDKNVCDSCGYVGLIHRPIKGYDHAGGWAVEGHPNPQWLYVECPDCRYEHALWKLGVPREQMKEFKP